MLALKIDNKFVDLPNDFSITMNLKSPIFGEIGSYSYPFLIPTTPRNAIIFNFGHRVESTTNPYLERQGEFFWNGLSLFSGTVKLKVLNSKTYEGTIFEGEGDFYYLRKTLSLQDVDFGHLYFSWEVFRRDYINGCANTTFPDRNIAFPRILDETYFEEGPITDQEFRYFNYYENGLVCKPYNPQFPIDEGVIVPMLYLRFVLTKIFEYLNYSFVDSFFSNDVSFNSLVLYNSVDCNAHINGYFEYSDNYIWYNYHLPRMSLGDFFLGLETFFNIRLFVNNKTKTVRIISLNDIITSSTYSDIVKNVISISSEIEDKIQGYKLEMQLDSDDSCMDNITTIDETHLGYIKSPVQTFTKLPPWPNSTNLEIRYVIDVKLFYRMTSGSWVLFDINNITTYSKFLYKSIDGEVLTTKVSTLSDILTSEVEVGNKRDSWRDITCRLFFVKATFDLGQFYAMEGQSYTATTSLFYNGANGLFNKQFKAFCDFRMNTKLVKITAQLGFTELNEFDFSKKYMILGTKYLVKNLQVTLKKDRIMPALLECYPCP